MALHFPFEFPTHHCTLQTVPSIPLEGAEDKERVHDNWKEKMSQCVIETRHTLQEGFTNVLPLAAEKSVMKKLVKRSTNNFARKEERKERKKESAPFDQILIRQVTNTNGLFGVAALRSVQTTIRG